MPQRNQTRPDQGRVRCDCFPASRTPALTPVAMQAQRLIAFHAVHPDLAAMLAALIFGRNAA